VVYSRLAAEPRSKEELRSDEKPEPKERLWARQRVKPKLF